MDKPLAIIQKIIPEEDKVYNITIHVQIKRMGIGVNTSVNPIDFSASSTGTLTFTDVEVVDIPSTITIAKNPNTMNNLMNDIVTFNRDRPYLTNG